MILFRGRDRAGSHARTPKRRAVGYGLGLHREQVAAEIAKMIARSAAEPGAGCGKGCDCPPCVRYAQAEEDAQTAMRVGKWRDKGGTS